MLPVDLFWVLLDIPQGAITIGSAILVVLVGALLTLAIWIFRLLYSIQGRVTVLETRMVDIDTERVMGTNARMEIIWDWYIQWARNLRAMEAPENPMKQERWNELADKLHSEELSDEEAQEFLAALQSREEQARNEKDLAALAILGPGIILTRWQLKERELREQVAKTDARNR